MKTSFFDNYLIPLRKQVLVAGRNLRKTPANSTDLTAMGGNYLLIQNTNTKTKGTLQ
jgi:hypothetical protein